MIAAERQAPPLAALQTGMAEPMEMDKLLRYDLDAGEGFKVKVGP